MSVPAAAILVSFKKEPIERAFSMGNIADSNFRSVLGPDSSGEELDNEDVFLFDTVGNPNFISMQHSVAFGEGQKVKLQFIDPQRVFEKRFTTTNLMHLLGTSLNTVDSTTINSTPDPPSSPEEANDPEHPFNNFRDEYTQNLLIGNANRYIYLAYGVGNNLESWAGPIKLAIMGASVKVSPNRIIDLVLAPIPNEVTYGARRGIYNEPINLNTRGNLFETTGEGNRIVFDRTDGPKYRPKGIDKLNSVPSIGEPEDLVEEYDIHCMVVDVIRSYIRKVTNTNNVIVLLPNINVICAEAIEILKEQFAEVPIPTGGPQPGLTGTGESALIQLGKVLDSFTLRLGSNLDILNLSATPDAAILPPESRDAAELAHLQMNDRIHKPYKTTIAEYGMENHRGVLDGIKDAISEQAAGVYNMAPVLFYESQTELLSLWAQRSRNNPLFFGEAGPDGGLDNSDPVIIYGDAYLVERFLYASKDFQDVVDSVSELENTIIANSSKIQEQNDILETADVSQEDAAAASGTISNLQNQNEAAQSRIIIENPLHPIDEQAFDVAYGERVREIIYTRGDVLTAFGESAYLDELSEELVASEFNNGRSKPSRDTLQEYISSRGIPVFRFGIKNSNILDIKADLSTIYLQQLVFGFQREMDRIASATIGGFFKTNFRRFKLRRISDLVAYLRLSVGNSENITEEDFNNLIDLAGEMLAEELSDLNPGPEHARKVAAFAWMWYQDLRSSDEGKQRLMIIDQLLPGNPDALMADFIDEMYRKAVQMSITTLPAFHLSNYGMLLLPSIVLINDIPISQTLSPQRKKKYMFLSGLWNIMGFQHTITNSDMRSEFRLAKHIKNTSDDTIDSETLSTGISDAISGAEESTFVPAEVVPPVF